MDKRIALFIILITISQFVIAQITEGNMVKLTDLEGTWYINQSNFPMWLRGDKTLPTFNYTVAHRKSDIFLLDKVAYLGNGKQKAIHGIDRPLNNNNSEFVWRGKGILRLLKSEWKILHLDTVNQWAIIYFEKTLFTPKGYDVISRNTMLSAVIEQDIKNKLHVLGVKQKLTTIIHNDG